MKFGPSEIKRVDNVLQVEIWPSAESEIDAGVKVELNVVSENNVTQINALAHIGPVCENGVCQLGGWKPKRNIA